MLNIRKLFNGLNIVPRSDGATAPDAQGDLAVSSADGNLYYNNGTTVDILNTSSNPTTLSNKIIPLPSNTITSPDPGTVAQFDPVTGNLDSSITTSTELSYVHGVTSSIQTQLNNISGSAIDSLTGDVTATGPGAAVATLTATTNGTIITLSALSLPYSQLSGTVPTWNQNTTGTASNVTGIVALINGGTGIAAGSANAAYNALSPMTTIGDIEYESATGIASRLPIGLTNQLLSVSAGGIPTWTTFTALTNPMTTTGDLIYSSDNLGTPSRLPIGTTGQVLEVTGGIPSWVTQGSAEVSGVIKMFGGTTAPSGYFICDGTAYSRTTYASLFTAIGTAYGVGDGSTTFNIPDFRGIFPRGVDNGAGNDPDTGSRTATNGGNSGDNVGSLQGYQVQSHNHSASFTFYDASSGAVDGVSGTAGMGSVPETQGVSVGTFGGNETRPINLYVNFIIKQ